MREKKYDDYNREDREALAAVAMAFAPATEVPRERALIRSAILSLLLYSSDKPFTRNEGIAAISAHGALPELRRDIAESIFDKLVSANIVCTETVDNADNFRFNKEFAEKTYSEQDRINTLVDRVISDLFESHSLSSIVTSQLRKELLTSIARLMKKYGEQYAYQIAGRAEKPIVVHHEELVQICEAAMSRQMKTQVKPKEMADAITELFGRKEPHFAAFVFSLTQNYYYLRLLGLAGGLDYLAENRFSGSQFLLDTNMLFPLLLEESRHRRSTLELVDITQKLNISLHETEITLEELRRVVNYNCTELSKAFDEVPDDLVSNTQSVLLRGYRTRKQQEQNLTVEVYLSQFTDVRDRLEKEWGVTVFNEPVEWKIPQSELDNAKKIINESSQALRHRPKPNASLEHDAHVYYVVLAERQRFGNKAAWLLTLDTSLPHAARKLQGKEDVPFCMSLDGFLHIISPYVRSDHQQSFAEMFVELVGNNLFPPEEVIEMGDFLMFTNFDLSVRQLPSDDVKKVIRRVKKALGGTLSLETERQRVGYEVQKALCDPTLKYRTELESALKERETKIKTLEEARDRDREKYELELVRIKTQHITEFEGLNQKLREMSEKGSKYELEVQNLLKKHRVALFSLKAFLSLALLGVAVRVCWWLIDSNSAFVKDPPLCKVLVIATAVAALVGILSPKKWLSLVMFILTVLGVLFSAWAVFCH